MEERAEFARPKFIQKLWGHEQIIVNKKYCGKILTVLPNGNACSIHYHKKKHETFHILEGDLFLQLFGWIAPKMNKMWGALGGSLIDSEGNRWVHTATRVLLKGQTLILPAMVAHRFWTVNQSAVFAEFSTHDDPDDSYRILESGPAPKTDVTMLPRNVLYEIPAHLQEQDRKGDSSNARGSRRRVRSKIKSSNNR